MTEAVPHEPSAFIERVASRASLHRAPIPGGELAIRSWGDPQARPIVLLHGGFGSWRHWILNIEPLARRHRVLCVDLPGLGDSDALTGDYTPDAIAVALRDALDHVLGASARYAVVGFSFGGIVGSDLAALLGERALGFVAVAPGALGLGMYLPALESLSGRREPDNVRAIHRTNLARLMLHDPDRIDALALEVQRQTVLLARARSGRIPHSRSAALALARCVCPIAGVWGERDVIALRHMHQRRALFRRIQPGCPFHLVQGAGHWVMYERPERFNPLLLSLLERFVDERSNESPRRD